ncbi:MAG: asparagine synthase (glutamine-hydrolyzing) [Flavobacteriaceae bacterium]
MCGINGVYNYRSLTDVENKVKEMNSLTNHRGPDFNDIYLDSTVCLGHNRLAIIDLDSKSNQPFISNDENLVLVYNGEIYNFLELKKQLSKSYKFKTESDTEIIIAAYHNWGINMVAKFNGMFSFALWDKKNEQFFLCRDRLGIKPLYYSEYHESIIFSSSIKAINQYYLNKTSLNKDDFVDFLRYGTVHSPNTFLNEIKSLERASYLVASSEETKIVEYWSFFSNSRLINKEEKPQIKIKNFLLDSVDKRMMSDVPFGIFLSGGIDSSILVAAASKVSTKNINTFSIVFKDKSFDERKFSRIIASKYKTNHFELELTPEDILHQIEEPFKFMDHPSVDGINTYFISKQVQKKGYKMAISGAGADELFSGYPVFKNSIELSNKKWLFSFPPQFRKLASKLLYLYKPNLQSEKMGEILNLKLLELSNFYPIFRKIFSDSSIMKLFNHSFNLKSPYSYLWAENELSFNQRGHKTSFLNKVSSLEIETYLQNVLLRDADQMGMANSLEIRVPFLDHNLVEYVLSLPNELKFPSSAKKLLIDSTKGWIPDEIINRKKMGFVFPWDKWMRNELKTFCEQSINSLEHIPFFNMNYVNTLWVNFLKNKSQVHWLQIWSLVVLGNWTANNSTKK